MDDKIKLEVPAVPTLTLTPDLGQETVAEAIVVDEPEVPAAPALDDSLTPEERAAVDNFASQIDLTDSSTVLTYGAGAQKKMADFSETALESVRTQDLGEVGGLITDVVGELRSFDVAEEKGFLGFFKKAGNKIETMKAKYDKAEVNIDKIAGALQKHQMTLMKDTATLDKLYDLNLSYFKELTMYIMAGKKRLEEVRQNDLAELAQKARLSGRTEDAEAVQKLEAQLNRFEKKLSDLDLTRTIALQTAPQIRLVQNNEMMMVEKIQTTIVNTIPLWKSQMVLALGIANSNEAVKAQTTVTNMTNELLRKNAELLHTSTVQIAQESERGIVDIETLKATNESLIKTFDEVIQIQEDGRKKRAEAELEMRKMEGELREKLLDIKR